ncbi:MAG TPA: hypothetical protein PLT08_17545 [Anaerolineales bacterium]|nr:hypothetical protein [Anaerolineales bacterium]
MNKNFRLDAWAEYAILSEVDSQFSIEFRRVPIDVEKVKNVWLNSGRPDAERDVSLYYQE